MSEIGEIIFSPAGLAVGVMYAIFSQIIIESIKLVFGKSKNAILKFATERSKNQKELRRWRVRRMRKNMKEFHLYVAQLSFNLHMATGALVLSGVCFLAALLVKHIGKVTDTTSIPSLLILGGFTTVFFIILVFQALAVQQDLIRSVIEPPLDKRGVPLWEPIEDDDKAHLLPSKTQ